jgi:hypothetical protein
MSLHYDTLQDVLKNVSIVLVTLCFQETFENVTKLWLYSLYRGKLRKCLYQSVSIIGFCCSGIRVATRAIGKGGGGRASGPARLPGQRGGRRGTQWAPTTVKVWDGSGMGMTMRNATTRSIQTLDHPRLSSMAMLGWWHAPSGKGSGSRTVTRRGRQNPSCTTYI